MRSLLLMITASSLAVGVSAQQIVIEPTNGRTQPAVTRVSRPALQTAPAVKAESKPARPQESSEQKQNAAKSATKRHAEDKAATKAKPASATATEVASNVTHETVVAPVPPPAPPVKKYPARPAWAMSDTRDANAVASEISGAIARDVRLKDSAIQVKVDEDSVTLEGHSAGKDERLQAERLAQSYAWNRKVVDRVVVVPRIAAQR